VKVYKKALVTGGAQRIGASIVEFLANNGIDVAIQYNKSEKEVNNIKKKVMNLGVKFNAFQCDFSQDCNFEIFFEKLNKVHGNIDILINNASTFEFDTIKKTSIKTFDKHINVNLKAPFFLSKSFVQQLLNKNGLIVNIIDQRVKNITPYFTSYTLSKSALYTMTKSLAVFLAPKIRVNGISPGPTLKSVNQTPKQFKDQISRTPMKRKVELDEINNALGYLIKNKSVTGEILTLDSGQSLGWANSKSKVFSTD
jgi:NAD(P)-dependent dehydrogenase (short-subunit alcohol dehydrogenase family)|tara:strand:- start:212 stop:973 length:762 start_codon:yes stop_codon:yes gene_type:complete